MEAIGLMVGKRFLLLACSSVARRTTLGHVEDVAALDLKKVAIAENPTSYALWELLVKIEWIVVTLGHIWSQQLCLACFALRLPKTIRTSLWLSPICLVKECH
jgi:hypothetical protein